MKFFLATLLALLGTSSSAVLAIPNPTPINFEERDAGANGADVMEMEIAKRQFTGDPNVSKPFALLTSSKSKEYNNLPIIGTHTGAGWNLAIPVSGAPLPPDQSNYYTYYLNTTFGSGPPPDESNPNPDYKPWGSLVYPIYPQYPTAVTASLTFNTSSNIAAMVLTVSGPLYLFEFQKRTDYLGINGVFDRWHVCDEVWTAYGPKKGIAWQMGRGEIDQGSAGKCKRVWIKKVPF